jgi:hypothetical protein
MPTVWVVWQLYGNARGFDDVRQCASQLQGALHCIWHVRGTCNCPAKHRLCTAWLVLQIGYVKYAVRHLIGTVRHLLLVCCSALHYALGWSAWPLSHSAALLLQHLSFQGIMSS